jgi:hypothetical protein
LSSSEETKQQSLNELRKDFYSGDLLLKGTLTIQVEVSIERHRHEIRDDNGQEQSILDPRCLVHIYAPSDRNASTTFFADGEQHMTCILTYSGGINDNYDHITLDDVIKALSIDPEAKIWRAQENL